MVDVDTRQNQRAKVRPRGPLILSSVPANYYSDNQLAAVIQSVEAALFAVCFRSYPQAFSIMYSGLEKLCKNISKLGQRPNFRDSWENAGKTLELLDHPIFSTTFDSKGMKIYALQRAWSNLRNEIEHNGDSPSYDSQAAILLFGSLWDAYELLLSTSKSFDLRSALPQETRRALDLTKEALGYYVDDNERNDVYFDKPLVCQLRSLVRPAFEEWSFDDQRYYNSDLRFEGIRKWRSSIERSQNKLEWRDCDCPICKSPHSVLGFSDLGDDSVLIVKFEAFLGPQCNFTCLGQDREPHLAQITLRHAIENIAPEIQKDCGASKVLVRW